MTTKEQLEQALTSEDEEIRLQGLRALADAEPQEHLELIFQAFGDASWRVRKEAIDLYLKLPVSRELVGEIVELLHAEENAGLRNAAVEILVRMGQDAVPMLLDQITCPDHDVRKFIVDILGDIAEPKAVPAILNALRDDDSNVRAAAAENLGKIGAREAVPALLEAMQTDDILFRFTILDALGKIGVPVPLERLSSFKDEKLLRKALMDCLGKVGDATAVDELVQSLTDPMRNVREAALLALNALANRYPQAVCDALTRQQPQSTSETLVALLQEDVPLDLKRAAVRALGWMADVDAVLPMLSLLDEEAVQQFAVVALVNIGCRHPDSLLDAWCHVGDTRRAYLAYIMGEADCHAAVELLLSTLEDDNLQIKQMAVHALGRLGSPDELPALVRCVIEDGNGLQEAATQALINLGGRYVNQALEALRPLLDSADQTHRMSAVTVLGRLSSDAVLKPLSVAFKDPAPEVRRAAVKAFEGRSCAEHLSSLLMALTDEDAEVRKTAINLLGDSGDEEALDGLQLSLNDEDIWVRATAVRALGRLGGKQSVAAIEVALSDPVGLVAIAALETLADLLQEDAGPYLAQALGHPDDEVVTAALDLVNRYGCEDLVKTHAEALLNHRYWAVRGHSARLLVARLGGEARPLLEQRLSVEAEDLVKQQLQELLDDLR